MLVEGIAGVDNVLAVDSSVRHFISHRIYEIDASISRQNVQLC
jgi:hypothetical protein